MLSHTLTDSLQRSQNNTHQQPARLAIDTSQWVNHQRHVRQPKSSPALSTESAPVFSLSGFRSQAPSDITTTHYRKSLRYVPQPIYSPAFSAESSPPISSPRLSIVSAPSKQQSRVPQAPSTGRRSPNPAPLNIAATQNTRAHKLAFQSPPGSADSTSSFASQSTLEQQSFRAPHSKLNKLVIQVKNVRGGGFESPGGSSMRSLGQTERGFSSPSSTFSFSPVTPVAMKFDYPLIFATTPTLESTAWDEAVDAVKMIKSSPQGTAVPNTRISLKTSRGRYTDNGGSRHGTATRTSSHMPSKSAFPSNSPAYILPTITYSALPRKQGSAIAEASRNVGSLDRTANWVMCVSPDEERDSFSFGSIASDREEIMRSYIQRL